jgi:hypothetical protein
MCYVLFSYACILIGQVFICRYIFESWCAVMCLWQIRVCRGWKKVAEHCSIGPSLGDCHYTNTVIGIYFKINGNGWVQTGTLRLLRYHHYWNIPCRNRRCHKLQWLMTRFFFFLLMNIDSFSCLVILKMAVFWVAAPCSLVEVYRF